MNRYCKEKAVPSLQKVGVSSILVPYYGKYRELTLTVADSPPSIYTLLSNLAVACESLAMFHMQNFFKWALIKWNIFNGGKLQKVRHFHSKSL